MPNLNGHLCAYKYLFSFSCMGLLPKLLMNICSCEVASSHISYKFRKTYLACASGVNRLVWTYHQSWCGVHLSIYPSFHLNNIGTGVTLLSVESFLTLSSFFHPPSFNFPSCNQTDPFIHHPSLLHITEPITKLTTGLSPDISLARMLFGT